MSLRPIKSVLRPAHDYVCFSCLFQCQSSSRLQQQQFRRYAAAYAKPDLSVAKAIWADEDDEKRDLPRDPIRKKNTGLLEALGRSSREENEKPDVSSSSPKKHSSKPSKSKVKTKSVPAKTSNADSPSLLKPSDLAKERKRRKSIKRPEIGKTKTKDDVGPNVRKHAVSSKTSLDGHSSNPLVDRLEAEKIDTEGYRIRKFKSKTSQPAPRIIKGAAKGTPAGHVLPSTSDDSLDVSLPKQDGSMSIYEAMHKPSTRSKSGSEPKYGPTAMAKLPAAYIKTIEASQLAIAPIDIQQPPIPKLAYGLERVLFNPGIYQLQDPRSRVYNFDPYLQTIMPVSEFDFNALKEYITSSRDRTLENVAQKHGKRYVGSTSSMTGALAHFHFLLSQWREINASMLSKGFPDKLRSFTLLQRAPSAIFLKWKDGTYAIDADKEFASASVLSMLGKSMEKLLTLNTDGYERYRKGNSDQISAEERNAPESFHYSTMGDFLMRSQLDAHDARLPGTGMFDLKTRAVVSIRMDAKNYKDGSGYEIKDRQGEWESYEREYFDMIRAAFLKYSLQVRMGRMDGIFVAFHNTERIFGFQYISLNEMDLTLHGKFETSLGDQEFKLSLDLLNKILDKATEKFPEQSLRIHFETRESSTPFMYIFAEPVSPEQVKEIQSNNDAKIQAFESDILGLNHTEGNTTEPNNDDVQWENIQANVREAMERDELSVDNEGRVTDTLSDGKSSNNPSTGDAGDSIEAGLSADDVPDSEETDGIATLGGAGFIEAEDDADEAGEDEEIEEGADEEVKEEDETDDEEQDDDDQDEQVDEINEADRGQELDSDNKHEAEGSEEEDAAHGLIGYYADILRLSAEEKEERAGELLRNLTSDCDEDPEEHGDEGPQEHVDETDEDQAQRAEPVSDEIAEAQMLLDKGQESSGNAELDSHQTEQTKDIPEDTKVTIETSKEHVKSLRNQPAVGAEEEMPSPELQVEDSENSGDAEYFATINEERKSSIPKNKSEVLALTLTLRNKVNGRYVLRPDEDFKPEDEWSVEYALTEVADQGRAWALYEACQVRRKKRLDLADETGEDVAANYYVTRLKEMSKRGKEWRNARDAEEKGKPKAVVD